MLEARQGDVTTNWLKWEIWITEAEGHETKKCLKGEICVQKEQYEWLIKLGKRITDLNIVQLLSKTVIFEQKIVQKL